MNAQDYHNLTNYKRNQITPHSLDWENKPQVIKSYDNAPLIPLPTQLTLPSQKLSELLTNRNARTKDDKLTLEELSLLLFLSYTITAKARYGDEDFYFRSAASAGALYPSEIYVAVEDMGGLEDGLYYFSILPHALYRLRRGGYNTLISRFIEPPGQNEAQVVFIFTSIYYRSAWKYRDRAYRYCLLDTGHVIENVFLALRSMDLDFTLSFDFNDNELNKFLGIDSLKEFPLATCQVWKGGKPTASQNRKRFELLPDHFKKASRVSNKEKRYEAIEDIHAQGANIICPFGKNNNFQTNFFGDSDILEKIKMNPPEVWPEKMLWKDAIFARRSRRNFIRKPLDEDTFNTLFQALCSPDLRFGKIRPLFIGVLVGEDQPVSPGFYVVNCKTRQLILLKRGNFLHAMANACLNQAWLSMAAIHVLFLGDIKEMDLIWGPRGYRYALLEGGRIGQRLYLMATAMGMGCCGIGAFYDEESVEILGLKGRASLFYLIAVGHIKAAISGHI